MASDPGPSTRSKRSPPPLDSSEHPPAKKPGTAVINAAKEFLPYTKSMIAHHTELATVLEIEDHGEAIGKGPGDPKGKCLDILKHWLKVTENPTWNLFCSKLTESDTFNHVRVQIEKKHAISFDSLTGSLPQSNLTQEELRQLTESKIDEECCVWMELGVTGVGKSCLGNFILGQSSAFPESNLHAISETESASVKYTTFDDQKLCVIDTPGLGDTLRLGKHESKAMDIAEDYSHLITELTKIMLMTKHGINAFLIVITLDRIGGSGLEDLLTFLKFFGEYWNHSIVVVTHGNILGSTEEAQYATLDNTLCNRKCPSALALLSKKSNNRFVIVEGKEMRDDAAYRHKVVGKILELSCTIARQHGRYHDNLQSIGNEALEKAKLQLCHKFEDLESPEAKAAIFQSTFQCVREVIYKLVKIQLADGEDVDKLKEMATVKEKELSEIRMVVLEEQKRRREAEEEQRKEAERRAQAEEEWRREAERRVQAEEEQRREAERRAQAEEEQRREAERRAQAEEERCREAERRAQAEEERRREAEKRAQVEEEQRREVQRRVEAEEERRKEAERRAQAEVQQWREAQRRAQAEEQRMEVERRVQAEEKRRREAERRVQAEEEQRREAERRAQAEEERRREAERRAQAEEEQRREAERRAQAEEEQRREAERRAQAEEERRREAETRAQAEVQQWKEAQRRAQAEEEQHREAQRRAQAEEQRLEVERRLQAEEERHREAQRRAQAEVELRWEAQRRAEAEVEQRWEAQRRAETEEEQHREAQRRAQAEEERCREAEHRREMERQRNEAQHALRRERKRQTGGILSKVFSKML